MPCNDNIVCRLCTSLRLYARLWIRKSGNQLPHFLSNHVITKPRPSQKFIIVCHLFEYILFFLNQTSVCSRRELTLEMWPGCSEIWHKPVYGKQGRASGYHPPVEGEGGGRRGRSQLCWATYHSQSAWRCIQAANERPTDDAGPSIRRGD